MRQLGGGLGLAPAVPLELLLRHPLQVLVDLREQPVEGVTIAACACRSSWVVWV